MLINIFDPSLIVYRYEDWKNDTNYCFERIKSLILHRDILNRYKQEIAMSDELLGLIMQNFPWSHANIPEFRDVMLFMNMDMQKMRHGIDICLGQDKLKIDVNPDDVVCQYIGEDIVKEWRNLLYSCIKKGDSLFKNQIVTWDSYEARRHAREIEIIIKEGKDLEKHDVPAIWNEDIWYKQLVTENWWPDLSKCIEICHKTHPGMKGYSGIREEPFNLECEESFWDMAGCCYEDDDIRREMIEALTKLVYGIRDEGLGFKPIGKHRYRFCVTIHYRVHCRFEEQSYVLEKFAPREGKIDGIG